MSLRGQFHVAFGIIASLTILLVAYGVFALGTTRNLVFQLYDEPLVAVSYARGASAALNEARGVMDRALLTGPLGTADIMSILDRKYAEIADDLWIVRERTHDTTLSRTLGETNAAIADWFKAGAIFCRRLREVSRICRCVKRWSAAARWQRHGLTT